MNVYLHRAVMLHNNIAQPTLMVVILTTEDIMGKVLVCIVLTLMS
jgi:hypothetical protein